MKRYALLSVSDKAFIANFAKQLQDLGFCLLSTGGTAKHLQASGLEVTEVSKVTQHPEMLDGRVKTLHPAIHAGLLARRDHPADMAALEARGYVPIDLVVVNLYPFAKVLAQGAPEPELIENIDIGGPTMLRSAAKNFRDVFVVTNPQYYQEVIDCLKDIVTGGDYYSESALQLRKRLALEVFQSTYHYDQLIAGYLEKSLTGEPATSSEDLDRLFPPTFDLTCERVSCLRYGENPHQQAALYRNPTITDSSLLAAKQLHGKALSYNNIQDTNAALELLYEFSDPCVVALKHMSPCGLAIAPEIYEAWQKAYAADPTSIFGGIVAANREITLEMAQEMHDIFLEVVIAPGFEPAAYELLAKKKNIRLLSLPMQDKTCCRGTKIISVLDGFLMQERDSKKVTREDCRLMTKKAPTEQEWADLLHAFATVKHCKSNAIVVFKDGVTLGVGVGQANRVGAAKLALEEAGEAAKGAVLASDAFFPMPDTMELAARFGISSVIQPGGSIRDQDSIEVCDRNGMSMVATGIRCFKH